MFAHEIDNELRLVLLQPSMAEHLYQLVDANRDHLKEWMPWVESTRSAEDTKAFIRHANRRFADGESLTCGIEYHGELAGVISFNDIHEKLGKVVIGYWIAEDRQGLGIVTRCCRSLMEYAFNEMNMQKVEIRAAADNTRSRAVCERLGLKLEGVISNAEAVNGRIVDHAVYGIHKEG